MSGRISYEDLARVWRIVCVTVLCQSIGMAIGIASEIHHSTLFSAWLGGVAGTLPGFVLGLIWQIRSGKLRHQWLRTAYLLGFLATAITCFALFFVLPMVRREMQLLNDVRQLSAQNLQSVEVFDRSGRTLIVRIADPAAIASFSDGLADAAGHLPSHPQYSASWHVILRGKGAHREFQLHLDPAFPDSIIGDFVSKSDYSTSHHGTFRSRKLRPWVENNLIKREPADAGDID